jgi:hypothetical protein
MPHSQRGTILEDIAYYKPTLHEIITRYEALYAAQEPGHLCTFVGLPHRGEAFEPAPITAIDWESERSLEDYVELTLRNIERTWRANRDIADDNIPSAWLFFGIGEYSAFVAGEVIFQEDTSWVTPAIHDWADLDGLELRADNRWVQVLERGMCHLCAHCRPAGIPVVRGYYSPLDLARALRGEALFTGFFDEPEQVHRLLAFCAQATIWLAERLQAIIGEWYGGQVAGAWLPRGTICLSEDTACLVSPRVYAEYGRPYTQTVLDHFGHGQIHTHSRGLHVVPEISALRGLVGIQIAEDPNTPPTFARLDDLLPRCHGVPLTVSCTLDDLRTGLPELSRQANIILCPDVETAGQAEEALSLVRRHSRI